MPWPTLDERPPLPAHPIARPEHPRPDFRREHWLCLNGTWEFAFDPDDSGLANGWQNPGAPLRERIVVPFPWESPAAWGGAETAGDSQFLAPAAYREQVPVPDEPVVRGKWHEVRNAARRHRFGWYRRTFTVPPDWLRNDRRVFLVVGAADWEATVFCNGIQVGSHEGGYTPFAVELTAVCKPAHEENILVVRVSDPSGPDLPGGKQHWWYEHTSGIWQSVYLECRPEAHLTHLRVEPDVAGRSARVEVGVCPVAGDFEVRVSARSPHGEVTQASVVCPGCERRSVDLPLGPHPALWSPEHPDMYELTVEVAPATPARSAAVIDAETVERATDVVQSAFGMREISVGRLPGTDTPCLMLNGQPFYVRAALHQSFHPAGVYAYVDEAIIRRDLTLAKEAGLNALRIHIKVDDPRLYHWADRLGVAILYDLPNTARQSPGARRLWEQTLHAAIERDANHPSIIAWVLFNETWGLGRAAAYREDADTQGWVAEMVDLAKRLDRTRLVEDNSACSYDHVETDINSWHFYIKDYERARSHIADAVARTHPGSEWNFVPGRRQSDQPLINSEYGGIAAGDGDKDVSFCLKWLTNELRLHEKIGGYVYTELTDVEWEHNGLLRYGRLPKTFPYHLPDVLGPDVLVVDGPPIRNATPGSHLELKALTSIFSGRADGEGRLRWSVEGTDARGRHVHGPSGSLAVSWRAGRVTEAGVVSVPVPDRHGTYQVRLALQDGSGERICGTYVDVLVGSVSPSLPPIRAHGFAEVQRHDDYWVGVGAGSLQMTVGGEGDVLLLEAAAGVWQPRQTDPVTTASDVTVIGDGKRVGNWRLPDAPADARGVLSYAAGIAGAYGYLLRVPVGAGVRDIELRVGSGGIALFGPAAGRYMLGPTLV